MVNCKECAKRSSCQEPLSTTGDYASCIEFEPKKITQFDKLKEMSAAQFSAEMLIFRPSDACFGDKNKNYYALDGTWHERSQDAMQATLEWLNEEVPAQKTNRDKFYEIFGKDCFKNATKRCDCHYDKPCSVCPWWDEEYKGE